MVSNNTITTEVNRQLGVVHPYAQDFQAELIKSLAMGTDAWHRLAVRVSAGEVKAVQTSRELQANFSEFAQRGRGAT